MEYNKTTWESGETPLSAQNMNNIEEGIEGLYKGENELEFESGDTVEEPTNQVEVELLESGETTKTIIQKISNMFRNVRYILKLIGETDISDLSKDKTITGAISRLNDVLNTIYIGTINASGYTYNSNEGTELLKEKYKSLASRTVFVGVLRTKSSTSDGILNWRIDGMKSSDNYGYIKLSMYSKSGTVTEHNLVAYDDTWEWRD